MEPDIVRMLERQSQRIIGNDDVKWDEGHHVVAYYRHGTLIWAVRGELVGSFTPELGLFRWWFLNRSTSPKDAATKMRLDEAYREGQRYALAELTHDQVYVDNEHEAELIAKVAAQLSRADGLLRTEDGTRVTFIALYEVPASELRIPDAPTNRALERQITGGSERPAWIQPTHLSHGSAPPPNAPGFNPAPVGNARGYSVAPTAGDAPAARRTIGYRTMPPVAIALSTEPGEAAPPLVPQPPPRAPNISTLLGSTAVREPSREVFLPVAQQALAVVATSLPNGFKQALVVITVDVQEGRGRFLVQIVASDSDGNLASLDPSRELLDATAKMIGDDARDGNGRWRKLAARLASTARGASVDVEVKA